MSPTAIVILALLLAVPVSLKYCLSLETRTMLAFLRRRERDLEILEVRLQALGREREVVRGALNQVREQHRWATTRRDAIAHELDRVRRQVPLRPGLDGLAGEAVARVAAPAA